MEVVGPAIGVLLVVIRGDWFLCFMDSGGSSMYQPAGVAGAWL